MFGYSTSPFLPLIGLSLISMVDHGNSYSIPKESFVFMLIIYKIVACFDPGPIGSLFRDNIYMGIECIQSHFWGLNTFPTSTPMHIHVYTFFMQETSL